MAPCDAPPPRWSFWLSVLLLVWATLVVPQFYPGFHFGTLIDTDPYMRLARVMRLHETGSWFESVFPRDNAPFGNALHWSRPLDVILIAGGVALSPLLGFKDGLFWWSHAINPLCLLAGAWLLERGLRARFDVPTRLAVVFGLLIQPVVFSYCSAPRIDHHAIQVTLLCLVIALLVRYAYDDDPSVGRGALSWLGGCCGLGLWISFEFLTTLVFAVTCLWSLWVFGRRDGRRDHPQFLLTLAVVTAAALVVERGAGALSSWEIDRLSGMHLVLILALALTYGIIRLVPEPRPDAPSRRAGVLALAGAIAGLVTFTIFPDVASAPFHLVDPRVDAIFHADVVEIHSVYHDGAVDWNVAENLIFVLAAVPFLISRFRRRGADPLWVFVSIGVAIWLPLGLYQQRHALPAQVVLVLPTAALFVRLFRATGRLTSMGRRLAVWSALLVVAMAGPVALSAVRAVTDLARSAGTGNGPAAPRPVDLGVRKEMMRFLADPDGLGRAPTIVMADIDIGTMIVFETPHSIVASPYHRNTDGVVDAHAFFLDEGEDVAREIASKRGVGLILIERPRRDDPPLADRAEPLGTRLLCGRGPAWAFPVELPPDLAARYSLFRVALD